ncbi:MAG: T9SS type A sorting domain-containing protein [Ignavibacteriales bacterium]
MNKMKLVIATLTIFLLQNNELFAQEINGIPTGPIPKLKITEKINSENSEFNFASIAYGHSSVQDFTLSLPIPAGAPLTYLSSYNSSGFASSMCKGGDGKFYLIEYYFIPPVPAPSLYEFNPITGELILLGSISGLGTQDPTCIAYNPNDGAYYMCTKEALYSFDLNSRTVSFIGNFNLTDGYMDDICFDALGVCYAIAIGSAKGYTIDITTAVPTLLGSLGYYAIFGHGMSYDFETNTIYISAYNHTSQTGQLRTMDPLNGNTNLVTDWGYQQIAPFALDSDYGPPCPVSSPFNPNPVNGSTGVSITENELTWTNGSNTTKVEVWFGNPGNVVKVYDGIEISSLSVDTFSYSTTYNWRVVCKNDTCTSAGPYWSFLTESDSTIIFYEPFNNLTCWTQIGPQGLNNWFLSNTTHAGGSPTSEVKLQGYDYNNFNGLSQLISCPITDDSYHYVIKFRHMLNVYSGSTWQFIGLAVSYDGGVSKQMIWQIPISGDISQEEIETEFYPSSSTFQMILYFNGVSLQVNNWFIDDLKLIDDCMECFPPPPAYNLHAYLINPFPKVHLYWFNDAWNENGFFILRKNGVPNSQYQYELIATIPSNSTNYNDSNVLEDSTYTYSVVAYNQFGFSDTSNTATITITRPIPVELISFTGKIHGGKIILNWSTATELNNLGFEIERMLNGSYFYTIGFVEGNGTTTEIQNYSYTDSYAEQGTTYYRLKQIDFSGKFSYSNELEVDFNIPDFYSLGQNFPNPFNPSTMIKYQIPDLSFVTIKIYDVLGTEIATLVNEEKPAGSYEVEFITSSINYHPSSGIYFYRIQAGDFIETKKMILLK